MAQKGVSYIRDDMKIYPNLTCEENLEIARRVSRRKRYWDREWVEEFFPVLSDRRRQKGLSFSGGEKKILSLGPGPMINLLLISARRALMTRKPVA